MSVGSINNAQFKRLATELRCEPEALMGVSHVEAPRGGFGSDGFPTILFERHKFYKNARRDKRDEWQGLYPTICNRSATPRGGYGSMAQQRVKFSQAFALDADAAMMACSWGAFQELGENYDDYGFDSVGEFVDMMKSGIEGQLEIFVRSIKHRGLVDDLQRKDWAGFARLYNGSGYRRFEYDTQMANAYKIFKRKNIDWSIVDAAPQFDDREIDQLTAGIGAGSTVNEDPAGSQLTYSNPALTPVESPDAETAGVSDPGSSPAPVAAEISTEITEKETIETEEGTKSIETSVKTTAGDSPDAPPSSWLHLEDWKPLVSRYLKRLWTAVSTITLPGGFALGYKAMQDPPNWFIYAVIGLIALVIIIGLALIVTAVLLGIWYLNRKEIAAGKMFAAETLVDPDRKNLGVVIEAK